MHKVTVEAVTVLRSRTRRAVADAQPIAGTPTTGAGGCLWVPLTTGVRAAGARLHPGRLLTLGVARPQIDAARSGVPRQATEQPARAQVCRPASLRLHPSVVYPTTPATIGFYIPQQLYPSWILFSSRRRLHSPALRRLFTQTLPWASLVICPRSSTPVFLDYRILGHSAEVQVAHPRHRPGQNKRDHLLLQLPPVALSSPYALALPRPLSFLTLKIASPTHTHP